MLVVLSTSGNSENVVRAVYAAEKRGLLTIALLGKGGGRLAERYDYEWIIDPPPGHPAQAGFSDRILEVHMVILQIIVSEIERRLFHD